MVTRRRRGRPPRDYRDDPDLEVAEWSIALQAAWGLSERKAIDLAIAIVQGELSPASKLPRGAGRKGGVLVGYRLPDGRGFSSRNADIRRKLKAGKLRTDREAVLGIARLLLHIHGLV
jgi:hypothetical protein